MPQRNYWLDLFSGKTWNEFLTAGGKVSGFTMNRWATLQKVRIGDYFLCYLTGVSRFIGILEVISEPYQDTRPIWEDNDFPSRVNVKVITALTPDTAVPIANLSGHLSIFQNMSNPNAWTGHVRGSPSLWLPTDGEVVERAILEAKEHPIVRDYDPKKLRKKPQGLNSKTIGKVSVPDNAEETEISKKIKDSPLPFPDERLIEASKHTEVEHMLLHLGHEMGFQVWVARNDRNRDYKGKKFSEAFPLKDSLPLQFDEATLKTVELIDVLWLKGNAIVSAFEVESTTSIYSGLLRMSDLISMQPNINIPLYLVAPDDRRKKVFEEINRPTFSRLNPPLARICRYISFERLSENLRRVEDVVKYLKAEFLLGISEECEL